MLQASTETDSAVRVRKESDCDSAMHKTACRKHLHTSLVMMSCTCGNMDALFEMSSMNRV